MDIAAIQAAIRSAIGTALTLPDVGNYKPIVWEDTNASSSWNAPASPRVRLKMHEPQGIGQDAVAYKFTDPKLLPIVTGPRQFMVTVRIAAETQTPGAEPVGYTAMRLRSRLRWPRVAKILADADVAVALIRPTINASVTLDGRQTAMALVDLIFQTAENDTDTSAEGGYFTQVALGGKTATDLSDIAEKIVGVDSPPPGTDPPP